MQKTYYPKQSELDNRNWVLVDADGQNLGRLAALIATILMGKNKPIFTPGVDTGDFVIVINAKSVSVTGNKLNDKKYYRHSGQPGGFRTIRLVDQLAKHPDRVIEKAVWGMVPHNKYGRHLMRKIRIYAGAEHPHQAQQPTSLE